MFVIIWQYTVHPKHLQLFIEYYHAKGTWSKFFQSSASYIGTEFLQTENENRFITIDKWMNEHSYDQFLRDHKKKYEEIDKHCEAFTIDESLVGHYFLLEF
jgi:hypothetical protein